MAGKELSSSLQPLSISCLSIKMSFLIQAYYITSQGKERKKLKITRGGIIRGCGASGLQPPSTFFRVDMYKHVEMTIRSCSFALFPSDFFFSPGVERRMSKNAYSCRCSLRKMEKNYLFDSLKIQTPQVLNWTSPV